MAMNANVKSDASWLEKTLLFFSQVRTETSKVQWPTKDQVRLYVMVVIIGSAVSSVLLGGWDWIMTEVIKFFFNVSV